jgi:hypothetical protein
MNQSFLLKKYVTYIVAALDFFFFVISEDDGLFVADTRLFESSSSLT